MSAPSADFAEEDPEPCPIEEQALDKVHHFSLLALTARKYGLAEDDVDVSQIDTVLQLMTDSQLPLFGGLEPVPVHTDRFLLSLGECGAPRAGSVHIEEGLQEPVESNYPHILIQQDMALHASAFEVYEVLLHKLTHAWVHDGPGAIACYAEG